jgi:replication factor C subunit 2/4
MIFGSQRDPSIPWIEKYRPKKICEIAHNENLIEMFKNIVKSRDIPHMLFYGPPGTGKTSSILAIGRELFKEHFSNRVVEFNASDDRGINSVREKITYEAKKYISEIVQEDGTIIPAYKIIILDEADSMTDEAQDALRVIVEEYSKVTRFCFICNYISKITDAIKSRCSRIYFKKLSDECMISKLREISVAEKMDLDENIFKAIIAISGGDMRKAIMILQNIKYLYEFKKLQSKKLNDMTITELDRLYLGPRDEIISTITVDDVYNIAATINNKTAMNIISDIVKCKGIIEVSKLSKHIISMGYPVDNILLQLNNMILDSEDFSNTQKAIIFKYATKILFKMKECSNEYIQLLDYLSCVYSTSNNKYIDLYTK